MLITVITTEYEPHIIGGLGIVATQLSEAMAARGHEIIVLTKGATGRIEEVNKQQMRIFKYPCDSEYFSKRTQKFYPDPILHHLRKMNIHPDLIHVHSIQGDELVDALVDKYNVPVTYTCHSLISEEGVQTSTHKRMEQRQRHLIEHADHVISPSRWQALLLTAKYEAASRKTYVVPNGATIARHSEIWNERPLHRLLFVGRFIHSKCALETIQALSALQKENRKVQLDLIGQGGKDYTGLMRREVSQLHLTPYIRFLGSLPHKEVLKRMQHTGIVIVPSRKESFGLVALEAMGTATPLVSTASTGLSDFVTEKTASVITQSTAREIGRAVQKVWKKPDETLHRRYAAYALAKQFTWEQIAAQHEEIHAGKHAAFTPTIENER